MKRISYISASLILLILTFQVEMSNCDSLFGGSVTNTVTDRDSFSILSCIILLVILYLMSKYLAAQHEPNVCVYGKQSSTVAHLTYHPYVTSLMDDPSKKPRLNVFNMYYFFNPVNKLNNHMRLEQGLKV